jgi:glyoxylase-like metal-dependent hydrolase (beta-lactamase superfamily II)
MIFETLVVGPLQCNCIIVGCEQTHEALVVDPGDEVDRILGVLDYHGLKVAAILHTHAHFDHVGATKPLKDATGAPVYMHKEDLFLYQHLAEQVAMFGLKTPESTNIEHWFKEGDDVRAGTVSAQVLHTPGHSPGSVCFQLSDKLLSGDTLFAGGIGRTDLWGGSYEQIIQSIRTKLLTLPDDTEVYPGHGPPTTIGREKQYNPFLQEYF